MSKLSRLVNWKKRHWKKYLLGPVILLVGLELFVRFWFGLGDIPIYRADSKYEYIYEANQDVTRFGNHIVANEWGMRSETPSADAKVRIVTLGDSVINGGAQLDQDELSSELLQEKLRHEFDVHIQVLNVSSVSWGPDNAFAFIEEHGDFGASLFIMIFSSHDLHDNRHFRPVVGVHRAWPDAKPMLALTDAMGRYVRPKVKSWFGHQEGKHDFLKGFDDSSINSGWKSFFDYCSEHGIDLLVYIHPEKDEVLTGQYSSEGQELINLLKDHQIEYLLGLGSLSASTDYQDKIHPNANGHEKMTELLYEPVRQHVMSQLH